MRIRLLMGLIGCLWGGLELHAQAAPNRPTEETAFGLENRRLSSYQLYGFEARAKQKVWDWLDYQNALRSDEYPPEMKEHLATMAQELFVKKGTVNGQAVSDYLSEITQASDPERLDWVWERWEYEKNNYFGYASLQERASGKVANRVKLLLAKEKKQFGAESAEIWTVRIVEIK